MKKLRMARNGYILISFIFYISGIIYMILPSVSPMSVCIGSGIILIAYGIIKIIGYCSDDLYNLAFQHDLACGLLAEGVMNHLTVKETVKIMDGNSSPDGDEDHSNE